MKAIDKKIGVGRNLRGYGDMAEKYMPVTTSYAKAAFAPHAAVAGFVDEALFGAGRRAVAEDRARRADASEAASQRRNAARSEADRPRGRRPVAKRRKRPPPPPGRRSGA